MGTMTSLLNNPAFSAGAGAAGGSMGLGALGGVGLGLGAASGIANFISQQDTNKAQSDMQDKQIGWENLWRSNAHQTEVADLKKAGLNPILSAGGGGASVPTPGLPSLTAPQVHMPDLISYGVSLKSLEQAQQRINIDKANSEASIIKNLSDAEYNKLRTALESQGFLGKTFGSAAEGIKHTASDIMDGLGNWIGEQIEKVRNPVPYSPRREAIKQGQQTQEFINKLR